jgi:glycosyltransferase involved in cell wall biosynthesis
MKKAKLCLNVMVGNESHVIERMLNSCYKYIDYWIIQCNGTDNTQEIIEKFFQEKNIPGYCYTTEWHFPGWNSDHLVQECYKANHGCDWLFRIDADEQLQVDDNFDWSVLEDTSIQSWNVAAKTDGAIWYRNRIWNASLAWRFKHDKRHECIILPGCGPTEEEFQRMDLDSGFKHYIINDGKTWVNPTKFLTDALELENQHVSNNTLLSDPYHFFYVAKSYFDCYTGEGFPLGYSHQKEYARRCIFYSQQFVDYINAQDEMVYYAQYMAGTSYRFCGEYENAIEAYRRCDYYCSRRNEHICGLAECYRELKDYESMFGYTSQLVNPNRTNPFPNLMFLIHNGAYPDTGTYVHDLHQVAIDNL